MLLGRTQGGSKVALGWELETEGAGRSFCEGAKQSDEELSLFGGTQEGSKVALGWELETRGAGRSLCEGAKQSDEELSLFVTWSDTGRTGKWSK